MARKIRWWKRKKEEREGGRKSGRKGERERDTQRSKEEEEEDTAARVRSKRALWKTCYKILVLSLGNSEQVLGTIESVVGWEVRFPFGRIILITRWKVN